MRTNLKLFCTAMLLAGTVFSWAQQKNISGQVTDSNGFPVADAYVYVEGTENGVYTDANGNYSLSVNEGDTVKVEFIGLETKTVSVGNAMDYDVVLSKGGAIELNQVVAVAYGEQDKESLTGAVAAVESEEIEKVTSANVVQGLTGKVSGVQISSNNGLPGTSPKVRFRGVGSINGSSDPLYVVDGVPFTGSISGINNQDIESISFLKDAAASSLYGNRAANGVIIITTKSGKKGKPSYNINFKSGISSVGIPFYDFSEDPKEYYEYYHKMFKNKGLLEGMSADEAQAFANSEFINGAQGLKYNITDVAAENLIGADGTFNPSANILYQEDWKDFLFKDGFYTSSNFNASGATENTKYFYSLGYESNDTYMVNSKWEKATGRLKIDSEIGERIDLGGNMSYSVMEQNAPDGYDGGTSYSNPFQWTRQVAPIYPVHAYSATGELLYTSSGDVAFDDGTGTYSPFVRPYGSLQNPYATAKYDEKLNKIRQVFSSAYATVNLAEGLDFTYRLTEEYYNLRGRSLDTPLYGDAVGVNGRLYNWSNTVSSTTNQQLLEYDKNFNGFGLTVLAGHETYDRDRDYIETHVINGLLPDQVYSDMYATLKDIRGFGSPYELESWFGRVNMNWEKKYFLSGSFRRDGSSRFHPDNRWGNFYSVGASWIVSKEDWFKNDVVTNFKIRGSYGEVGNDDLSSDTQRRDFPYLDLYTVDQTTVNSDLISYSQTFKGNPEITWEKNKNMNIGLELGFFNNRLNIEAEYFKRKTNDLLFMRPLMLSDGFTSMPENVGDMENRGFEFGLDADVVKNADFNLNVYGNLTTLENEILGLPEDEIVDGAFILKEGNSMYTWRLREFVGVNPENGAALFTVIDEETGERSTTEDWSSATLIDTGETSVPDIYGGFGLNATYKNFDFSVNFAYQFGGTGYDWSYMNLMTGGLGENFHKDFYNTWSPDNKNAKLPVVLPDNENNYYATSTLGLIKTDYISLQNIALGYTMTDVLQGVGIESMRLSVTADNVYVWSKRDGYDPRMSYTGESDNNFTPIRNISFGLNVSF